MVIYRNEQLIVHRLVLNELKPNCYIVQKGTEALLIDPADKSELIIDYLKQHQLTLRCMLATHGHFDHISGAAGMIESGQADVLYIHEKDFDEVRNAQSYSLMLLKRKMTRPKVAMFDSERVDLLRSWGIGINHVGGHTKGSCYLYCLDRDFIITGDLILNHKLTINLFNRRENVKEIYQFLQELQQSFKSMAVILPGHGDGTTVGIELVENQKLAYVRGKVTHGN